MNDEVHKLLRALGVLAFLTATFCTALDNWRDDRRYAAEERAHVCEQRLEIMERCDRELITCIAWQSEVTTQLLSIQRKLAK